MSARAELTEKASVSVAASCRRRARVGGTHGAPARGMSKHKRPVPRVAKLTLPGGTALVDVESGILVGVSHDDARERKSSGGDAADEPRSRPHARPSSKLSRN
jgi:hypothetical protein